MGVFSKSRRRLCYGGSARDISSDSPFTDLRGRDLFALRRARFISQTHGDFSRWVRIWSDHGDERYSYAIPFKDRGALRYRHFLKRLWKTRRSQGWRNSAKINSSRTYCYCAKSDVWILLAPLGKRNMNHRTDIQQCVRDCNIIFRIDGTIWYSIIW